MSGVGGDLRRVVLAGVWVGTAHAGDDPGGGRFVIGRSAVETVQEPARASLSAMNRSVARAASRDFAALRAASEAAGSDRHEVESRSTNRRAWMGSGRCGPTIPATSCRRICPPGRANGGRRSERWKSQRRAIAVDTAWRRDRRGGGSRSSTACPPVPFRDGWMGAVRFPPHPRPVRPDRHQRSLFPAGDVGLPTGRCVRKARLRLIVPWQRDGGIRAGAVAGVVACRVWCGVCCFGFGSSRGFRVAAAFRRPPKP
jgi:hypothetical protein